MKTVVKSLSGGNDKDIELSDDVFGQDVRVDILKRMVEWQRARKRAGTHSTIETVAEISGSKRKPHPQKGTGRARQGNRYGPHMRGGRVVFGPRPRDYSYKLPKKVRKLAMRSALSDKAANDHLTIVDDLYVGSAKTKDVAAKLEELGIDNVLIVGGDELNDEFARAARNIADVDVLPIDGANVYDILNHTDLIIAEEAIDKITERYKG
jgi:large subunit ribosomal protein L4